MSLTRDAPAAVYPRTVGTVAALTRFPVKSTAGESLSSVEVDERGLRHDREWAAYTADGGIASGKTTRRFRKVEALLRWRSIVGPGAGFVAEVPWLISPAGARYRVDDPAAADAVSSSVGQPLTLRRETTIRHHDESAVHLVTSSSLQHLQKVLGTRVDVGRLRANIVLQTEGSGWLEDVWTGVELALGPDVVLRLGPGMIRCVMVDQAQADVPAGAPVLRTLGQIHDTALGLQAHVVHPGTISCGDQARLLLPS